MEVITTANQKGLLSKSELLQWINDTLSVNITKVEVLGTGSIYCQLLDLIYPGKVQVEKLIKCKNQDNLEFLQWFKKFFDAHNINGREYNAVERRQEQDADFGFIDRNQKKSVDKSNRNSRLTIPKSYNNTTLLSKNSSFSNLSILKDNEMINNVVGQQNQSKNSQQNQQSQGEKQLMMQFESLKGERDFYFSKLRDIDHYLEVCQVQDVESLKQNIRDILYLMPEKVCLVMDDGTLQINQKEDKQQQDFNMQQNKENINGFGPNAEQIGFVNNNNVNQNQNNNSKYLNQQQQQFQGKEDNLLISNSVSPIKEKQEKDENLMENEDFNDQNNENNQYQNSVFQQQQENQLQQQQQNQKQLQQQQQEQSKEQLELEQEENEGNNQQINQDQMAYLSQQNQMNQEQIEQDNLLAMDDDDLLAEKSLRSIASSKYSDRYNVSKIFGHKQKISQAQQENIGRMYGSLQNGQITPLQFQEQIQKELNLKTRPNLEKQLRNVDQQYKDILAGIDNQEEIHRYLLKPNTYDTEILGQTKDQITSLLKFQQARADQVTELNRNLKDLETANETQKAKLGARLLRALEYQTDNQHIGYYNSGYSPDKAKLDINLAHNSLGNYIPPSQSNEQEQDEWIKNKQQRTMNGSLAYNQMIRKGEFSENNKDNGDFLKWQSQKHEIEQYKPQLQNKRYEIALKNSLNNNLEVVEEEQASRRKANVALFRNEYDFLKSEENFRPQQRNLASHAQQTQKQLQGSGNIISWN
ncbi:EB1, C-terminal [Pseudocohnilembus persalinus]|uniref:EB1, C-terminal n=1 Tax=Pseudocohnilembus persalinus TaxID=266149 RepID=A0A0V0QPR8_PSEPJ|nr:EB1, C-terminal [Pseudocohnilembus persalinus]|eukprot:KRX04072.1 EB1, C-terminal [Pseudocohnilembus persalinus]